MADERLELHPWNRGFAWDDRSGPFLRLTGEQVASFDRDGFVVLPDVFGDDDLAPLIEAIDRNEAATEEFLRSLDDGRISIAESGAITFTVHLVEREPVAASFARHPVFADLFERRVDGLPRLIALAAAAVAGAALLVALPVWLFADQVVRALFGAEFDASAPALQILLLFFVLRSVRAVYVRAVCAAGHQRDYSRIAFGAVLALLPMLVATWAFGLPVLAATCWSLVLVEAMTLLAMWRLTGRLLRARVASAA